MEIAEERDSTGGVVLKRFYSQGFVDSDGTTLYYTRDHLGSIRELTDSSQLVRARYDYDPYGRRTKVQGDKDSPFTYTGHFWHGQSELLLTLYRAYDPNLGRWINRDPIWDPIVFKNTFGGGSGIIDVPAIAHPDQANDYKYVRNYPTGLWDPFGLKCEQIDREIIRSTPEYFEDETDATWLFNLFPLGGKLVQLGLDIITTGCKIINIASMVRYTARVKTTYWCDGNCGDPKGLKFEFGSPEYIEKALSSRVTLRCNGETGPEFTDPPAVGPEMMQ